LVVSLSPSVVSAGPEECAGGGPIVCLRFDDRPETPTVNVDYAILGSPSAPIVELRRGEDT